MTVLLIQSHFGPVPAAYGAAAAEGRLICRRERDLGTADTAEASGLITTTHLDQIGFTTHAEGLRAMLDCGGRWVFNGHMLRCFLDGLGRFVPLVCRRRADYALTRLATHPIFEGIEPRRLEENRGVAGFYGRGHNAMPPVGRGITGLGPERLPVDWEWRRPAGGLIFSHAGNDLGGVGEDGLGRLLAERVVGWCAGGSGR